MSKRSLIFWFSPIKHQISKIRRELFWQFDQEGAVSVSAVIEFVLQICFAGAIFYLWTTLDEYGHNFQHFNLNKIQKFSQLALHQTCKYYQTIIFVYVYLYYIARYMLNKSIFVIVILAKRANRIRTDSPSSVHSKEKYKSRGSVSSSSGR